MSEFDKITDQIKQLSQQFTTEIGGLTARITVLEDKVSEVPKNDQESLLGDNKSNLNASGNTCTNISHIIQYLQ